MQTGGEDSGSKPLSFVWLEITGRCQLECGHCYASSGPSGSHGRMDPADWVRVLNECAATGAQTVQFIGGEPTLHPALGELVEHALSLDLEVEVYSNLVQVRPHLWRVFSRPGMRLASSYYSDDPAEHASITKGTIRSALATRANITEAIRRGIPLRVGMVDVLDGQRVEQAHQQLVGLGVSPGDIGIDRLREVGRGQPSSNHDIDELCGHCASGVAAISPSGEVWPCVFSRWLPVGNVQQESITDILQGRQLAATRATLEAEFASRAGCAPITCGPVCPPCAPMCIPALRCPPRNNIEPPQAATVHVSIRAEAAAAPGARQ